MHINVLKFEEPFIKQLNPKLNSIFSFAWLVYHIEIIISLLITYNLTVLIKMLLSLYY